MSDRLLSAHLFSAQTPPLTSSKQLPERRLAEHNLSYLNEYKVTSIIEFSG